MTMVLRPRGSSFRRVFGMPILMAALSMTGLLFALLGDGPWDLLSWVALGMPLAVSLWHTVLPPQRGR